MNKFKNEIVSGKSNNWFFLMIFIYNLNLNWTEAWQLKNIIITKAIYNNEANS